MFARTVVGLIVYLLLLPLVHPAARIVGVAPLSTDAVSAIRLVGLALVVLYIAHGPQWR